MRKDYLLVVHLDIVDDFLETHAMVAERYFEQEIVVHANFQEAGIVKTLLKTIVYTVFATNAQQFHLHVVVGKILLQLGIAAHYVVLVVVVAWEIEMRCNIHLAKARLPHSVYTFGTHLKALRTVVNAWHHVVVHVNAKHLENGLYLVFPFQKIEHSEMWIEKLAKSYNAGTQTAQTLVDVLIATVYLLYIVDTALAFGTHGSN